MKLIKSRVTSLVRLLAMRMCDFHISDFIQRFIQWFPEVSRDSVRRSVNYLVKKRKELDMLPCGLYRWVGV